MDHTTQHYFSIPSSEKGCIQLFIFSRKNFITGKLSCQEVVEAYPLGYTNLGEPITWQSALSSAWERGRQLSGSCQLLKDSSCQRQTGKVSTWREYPPTLIISLFAERGHSATVRTLQLLPHRGIVSVRCMSPGWPGGVQKKQGEHLATVARLG